MKQEILPPLPAPSGAGRDADPAIDPDDLPPELIFTPAPQHSKRWAGINAQRQRIFITHLAATGAVTMAAKVIGVSTSALYQLRKREGADSFAAAWDKAIEIGARRIVDTLMEHAIYGIPETLSKDGEVILERRKFNTRAMVHIAASRFPEQFGGHLNLDGIPATAVPHSVRRLKEKWHREWEAERQAADAARRLEDNRTANDQDGALDDRLRIVRTGYQRMIAHDPVKRAAWDLLTGPGTDWAAIRKADAYLNPQKHEWHMHHPDMIVPLSAGAANVDWEAVEGAERAEGIEGGGLAHAEWRSAEGKDELWFGRYADHIVPGAAGESVPGSGKFAHGDMHAVADRLRDRAAAWQQARRPVIQHPPGFLSDSRKQGGPTIAERDAARLRVERAIEALEREWNAAYSEQSWAAWKAGTQKAGTRAATPAGGER